MLLLSKFLESVINLLGNQGALLHPSFRAVSRADAHKASLAFHHLHRLAVLHGTGLLVDDCDLIAQDGLRSGDVSSFLDAAAATATREGQSCQ